MKKTNTLIILISLALPVISSCIESSEPVKTSDETEPKSDEPQTPQNQLTEQEKADGWKLMFNGKDLTGWRNYKSSKINKGWTVNDQCIHLPDAEGGDILFDQTLKDFELKLQWKIGENTNSGLFLRAKEGGKKSKIWHSAVEVQIIDNNHKAMKSPKNSAGAVYGLYAPPEKLAKPVMQWNDFHVIVKGTHYQVFFNGEKSADFDVTSPEWKKAVKSSKFSPNIFGKNSEGFIGLQSHGGLVWFRNIKYKELKSTEEE